MRPALAALAVVLLIVWFRVWSSSREELVHARQARAGGDVEAAIRHYQYAIRWYSPAAGAPKQALFELKLLAADIEGRGDAKNALRAWRRLRGAIRATRSVYSPFADHADEVDRHIARLTAAEQLALGQPTLRGRDRAQLEADHLALLALDPTPPAEWGLLVVLSFLGWVSGGFLTIYRGFDRHARVVKPGFVRWALWTVGCFGLWVVSLAVA